MRFEHSTIEGIRSTEELCIVDKIHAMEQTKHKKIWVRGKTYKLIVSFDLSTGKPVDYWCEPLFLAKKRNTEWNSPKKLGVRAQKYQNKLNQNAITLGNLGFSTKTGSKKR